MCQINTHASFNEGRLSCDSNDEVNNTLFSTVNRDSIISNGSNSNSVFALNSPLPLPSLSSLSPVVSLPSSASTTSLRGTHYVTINTSGVFAKTSSSNNKHKNNSNNNDNSGNNNDSNSSTGTMDGNEL